MYLETMQQPDYFNEKWDNDDNIDYLIAEYGIDLRKLFQAEVETQGR